MTADAARADWLDSESHLKKFDLVRSSSAFKAALTAQRTTKPDRSGCKDCAKLVYICPVAQDMIELLFGLHVVGCCKAYRSGVRKLGNTPRFDVC